MAQRRTRSKQMALFAPAKRSRRPRGAGVAPKRGPRPRVERLGFVPHVARPAHDRRHPGHVSIRRVRLAPSFRTERVHRAILQQLAGAKRRGVRVVHYSIQDNHVHLMIEGEDAADLSNQMRTLFSRITLAVNAVAGRRGSLFRDRHHRRALATPAETRNALVYILFNDRKHALENGPVKIGRLIESIDECSSIVWFDDWDPRAPPPPERLTSLREGLRPLDPLSSPDTWLARVGWRRAGGPLHFHEVPRRAR